MEKWGGKRVGAGKPPKYGSAAEKQKAYIERQKAQQQRILAIAQNSAQVAHYIQNAAQCGDDEAFQISAATYEETLANLKDYWGVRWHQAASLKRKEEEEIAQSRRQIRRDRAA